MTRLPVLVLAALVVGACGRPEVEQLPEDRLTALEKAFNSGDAGSIAAFYAEDAILMPPNVPAIKGRAAIEEYFRESFSQAPGPATFDLTHDESFTSGATGVHRGGYTVTTPDGQQLEAGKFLEIWKNSGKEWQLAIDIWNMNALPSPTMAPPAAPEAPPPPPPGG